MNETSVALLVDGENVAPVLMQWIMDRVRQLGDPRVRCVFGDFSEGKLSDWPRTARQFGMEIGFQPSAGKGKNSTDIAMTIRAMDLLHEKTCQVFCLVSSDRDFVPLAQRLARSGRPVYCFGEAAAKVAFEPVCSGFFALQRAPFKATTGPSAMEKPALLEATDRIEDRLARLLESRMEGKTADGWIALSALGTTIGRSDPALAKAVAGKLHKTLKELKWAEINGTGPTLRVRLKPHTLVKMRAA
ncbi:MAG: NYN domain-containing protein [Rhizobiaceae bacterium]|nr:NYN domain-containing protein [Rhizobiaceae bacterium]